MKLSKLENEMLIDLYDVDMPGMTFEIQDYKLTEEDPKEKKQEFAYYLEKLKKLGLIKYEEKEAFLKDGTRSAKYNSNVARIFGDKIHIDSKGAEFVEMLLAQ